MKKILFVLGIMFPAVGIAQEGQTFGTIDKKVVCARLDVILKGLADPDIKEQPIWIGKDESDKSEYVIFVNNKTKSFTIVQMGKEVGCILGIGYKSYLIEEKKL